MPWGLCALSLSIFAFIISMIALLGNFFGGRGKWFLPLLLCVVVSSVWMGAELYRYFAPQSESELPLNLRPINPL